MHCAVYEVDCNHLWQQPIDGGQRYDGTPSTSGLDNLVQNKKAAFDWARNSDSGKEIFLKKNVTSKFSLRSAVALVCSEVKSDLFFLLWHKSFGVCHTQKRMQDFDHWG